MNGHPRRKRPRAGGGLLIAISWLAACAAPEPRPPSLIVISIDSLRADRLSCYGAERSTSPAIDALAAEGTLFESVVAPSPWTLPSHVTLFTGLPVPAHRVGATERRIDEARVLLPQHLSGLGYRTAAFVSAPFLDRSYGFDRGFDLYRNFQPLDSPDPQVEDVHERSHRDSSAREVVDGALAWLSSTPVEPDTPWFLFVHVWDVHFDYIPPAPYDTIFDPDYHGTVTGRDVRQDPRIVGNMPRRDLRHLRALYDGEIRWVDSQLARLFDAIRQREELEPIAVTLVSDHGEEFFEHGNKGHYKTLFEESVRVPWIVRYPGQVPVGARLAGIAGLEDVAPTLLGLAGLPPLLEATGQDLSASLREGRSPDRPQLLTFQNQIGLRGPGWKVLADHATGFGLYFDLSEDPREVDPVPVAVAAPERLTRLRHRLRRAQAHAAQLPWNGDGELSLDEVAREQLRSLGYGETSSQDPYRHPTPEPGTSR